METSCNLGDVYWRWLLLLPRLGFLSNKFTTLMLLLYWPEKFPILLMLSLQP